MRTRNSLIAIAALLILTGVGCTAKNANTQPSTPEPEPVFCTQEAKQCPDGSYVGRTGPNCEFTACPETGAPQANQDWKEIIIGGVVSFKIPPHCRTGGGAGSTYVVCPDKPEDTPPPEFAFSSDGIQVNMKRWEGLSSPYWSDVLATMKVIQPLTHKIQINIDQ